MVAILHKSNIPTKWPYAKQRKTDSEKATDSRLQSENENIASLGSRIMLIGDCNNGDCNISEMLIREGHDVLTINKGEKAISVAPDYAPDLIISEVNLENENEMDGLLTCERLKKLPHMTNVPIIFLTSISDQASITRCLQAGATDYIKKPFDAYELIARIENHLQIRRLTVERNEANKALSQKNQELYEANKAKDKLLSITTHDLKNPIATIRGLAAMLHNGDIGELNDEAKETIENIQSASDSIYDLVTELFEYSTLDQDGTAVSLELNSLSQLASDVTQLCAVNASPKCIQISFEDSSNHQKLMFDKRRIRRVFQNLIGNAIKFSPYNSTVTVKLLQKADHVRIEVLDEGSGIPEKEQCKLFKEYGRTSVKPTGNEVSTGLGLSICKKIMASHQGKIGMFNRKSKGACFYFTLPTAEF